MNLASWSHRHPSLKAVFNGRSIDSVDGKTVVRERRDSGMRLRDAHTGSAH